MESLAFGVQAPVPGAAIGCTVYVQLFNWAHQQVPFNWQGLGFTVYSSYTCLPATILILGVWVSGRVGGWVCLS